MKKLALLLLWSALAFAQSGNVVMRTGAGAPSGNCSYIFQWINSTNGNIYYCWVSGGIGTWTQFASGGGSGTVTSFSAGTLSPLFTTSVATATTTPALSFILSAATDDTVFMGSATPSYVAVPNCGSSNSALSYNTTTHAWGCQTISTGGAVTSVFTRTGAVTAQAGDYGLGLIGNPAAGTSFSYALNQSSTWTLQGSGRFNILGTPLQLGAAATNTGILDFFGTTSGNAQISVADAAGTPNKILLPTATGGAGTVLSTDGGSPQQLSWIAAGSGTVTSVATTSPITGGTITTTGTIACATCVTSAAALTSNAFVFGGALQASKTLAGFTSDGTSAATFGVAGTGTGKLTFAGTTSGSAAISVAAAAGTPNAILLPTATGSAGAFLSTDGANPQQLSWAAITDNVYFPFGFALDGATGRLVNGAYPSSGGPAATVSTSRGAGGAYNYQPFADAVDTFLYIPYKLHSAWTGTLSVIVEGASGSTAANNVVWSVATSCPATNDALLTLTYNTASTGTQALDGVSGHYAAPLSLSSVDVTGCSAGQMMWLKVGRLGTDASDTYAGANIGLGITVVTKHN